MSAKKIIKIIIFPFTEILNLISGIIPRSSKIWVFGAQKNTFTDNTKHLFISITIEKRDIKAVWITSDKLLIRKIRTNGGISFYRWSLSGIFYTMRAKYWFITTTIAEINSYTCNGANVVNQWHGIALKKIYFDTDNPEDQWRYNDPSFLQRKVYEPFTYRLSDFVISTSDQISSDSFSSALKVDLDKCLNFGQSRTDIFFYDDLKYENWISKWESDLFISIIDKIKEASYTWVYMPTWRDNNPLFVENLGLDFNKINTALIDKNELLIIKLHPYTPGDILKKLGRYSNFIIMQSSQDMYPLLKFTDTLITDYSSIYIDYLLLNKPIVFFCFDLQDYIKGSRGFYYNYEDVAPGPKLSSAKEFEALVCSVEKDDKWKDERKKSIDFFYDYTDGNSSQRIIQYFSEDK